MVENVKNKKMLVGLIIGVVTLLIITLGATYAFFQISVKNNTTEASVNLHAGELNSVALNQEADNLHIKLSAEDMSTSSTGDYYAVTEENLNYKKGTPNIVEIANIKTQGTIEDTCSGEIVVSISEDMAKVLEEGDAYLYIKGGDLEKTIDLTEIKNEETKTKTYTSYFDIDTTQNTEQNIQAWLKVVNKDNAPQNYLAGLTLNLTININNFKCGVEKKLEGEDPLTVMRRTDANNTLGGEDQATAVDGLLRYKGSYEEVKNNYICFGTDDEGTCTSDKDTYMYRIIGITNNLSEAQTNLGLQEGQLKLIKAVPPTVKDTNGCTYEYYNESSYEDFPCDGLHMVWGNGNWERDDYYGSARKYLNSDYLKIIDSSWQNIITNQKWFNAENQKISTKEIDTSSTTNNYQIGLMYASDYYNSWEYPTDSNNTNSWLHLNHGLNNSINIYSTYSEWTMSYWGYQPSPFSGEYAIGIYSNGALKDEKNFDFAIGGNVSLHAVRPSFYLTPSVLITGEGSEEHPFIITNVAELSS